MPDKPLTFEEFTEAMRKRDWVDSAIRGAGRAERKVPLSRGPGFAPPEPPTAGVEGAINEDYYLPYDIPSNRVSNPISRQDVRRTREDLNQRMRALRSPTPRTGTELMRDFGQAARLQQRLGLIDQIEDELMGGRLIEMNELKNRVGPSYVHPQELRRKEYVEGPQSVFDSAGNFKGFAL